MLFTQPTILLQSSYLYHPSNVFDLYPVKLLCVHLTQNKLSNLAYHNFLIPDVHKGKTTNWLERQRKGSILLFIDLMLLYNFVIKISISSSKYCGQEIQEGLFWPSYLLLKGHQLQQLGLEHPITCGFHSHRSCFLMVTL